MKTQKELIREQREQLKIAWHERWPNGQFVVQKSKYLNYEGIYWNRERRTSWCTTCNGIFVRYNSLYEKGKNLRIVEYQDNSDPYCWYYKEFEKAIWKARKENLNPELIELFLKCFKEKEGMP